MDIKCAKQKTASTKNAHYDSACAMHDSNCFGNRRIWANCDSPLTSLRESGCSSLVSLAHLVRLRFLGPPLVPTCTLKCCASSCARFSMAARRACSTSSVELSFGRKHPPSNFFPLALMVTRHPFLPSNQLTPSERDKNVRIPKE